MDLSKFATSLVLSERKDPKVTIGKDHASFTVGTRTMSLDKLREGLKELIDTAWKTYHAITQRKLAVEQGMQVNWTTLERLAWLQLLGRKTIL